MLAQEIACPEWAGIPLKKNRPLLDRMGVAVYDFFRWAGK
jgi:hypothetical protein